MMLRHHAVYAVIGDLVGSRRAVSREALHGRLKQVLDGISNEIPCIQPPAPTVGDEFQALYSSFADAARATLLVRLLLRPTYDIRVGIGYGDVEVVDTNSKPLIQDGSAWWNAREALEELGTKARRDRRTWLVGEGDAIGSEPMPLANARPYAPAYVDVVNAHFTCRDALVDRLGDKGRHLLLGSLRGETQTSLSNQLQVTQGAVSQQFSRGVSAVRDAQLLLEGVG